MPRMQLFHHVREVHMCPMPLEQLHQREHMDMPANLERVRPSHQIHFIGSPHVTWIKAKCPKGADFVYTGAPRERSVCKASSVVPDNGLCAVE
mmetsp:Transcript_10813/g.24905  ORF Transcript_10813/g.24905 Transcript_10813/m.24905 type:complete len:93 (-) Transcript_10813:8-286(-)